MPDAGSEPAGDGRGRERNTAPRTRETPDERDEVDETAAQRTAQTEDQLRTQRAAAATQRQRRDDREPSEGPPSGR